MNDDADIPAPEVLPTTAPAKTDAEVPAGRTAIAVTALLIASSALGLLRDLSLAGLFGASADTDAFLVAWTIPETVTVLLMEGALSYLLIPVFVRELSRRDSISRVVRATLLPMLAVLTALTAGIIVAAPPLIDVLAPGIAHRQLAIDCFRIAAGTVLFMGVAGYLMAALRAHRRFVWPASTYVAYNVGILAAMYALHSQLGVRSAALGLSIGSALMVLVQVPVFLRLVSLRGLRMVFDRRLLAAAMGFVPVAGYSLGRQLQVFVERIVGSDIGNGAISYMNYASKVAQMASLVALTAAAIAFPSLTEMASDAVRLRKRVELEARRLVLLVTPSIVFLVFFAVPSIELLFQHGAFHASDTARTAVVMRVYCLGLMGQVFVSLGAYVCYGSKQGSWSPARAAATGLVVTVVLDVALAPWLGVVALAVGNAAGITVSAAQLWLAVRRRIVRFDLLQLTRLFILVLVLSGVSAGVAWGACQLIPANALLRIAVGGILTVVLLLLATAALDVPESRALLRALPNAARRVRSGRGAR